MASRQPTSRLPAPGQPARGRGTPVESGDARSRARELRILKTIAEALNGASDVDEALRTTLREVAGLLGLRAGWIWLTDPQTGRFYSAVAQRLPPLLREPLRMTGRTCWCLDAFRAGALTAGNIDVMECSRLRPAVAAGDRARTRGLRYHASIPLYFGDRPLGIMNVAAPEWRKLTRRELDLLSTIASQVGVAIERARLAGESVQIARMEERTRLARQIHDTLAQQLTAIGLHIEAALDALPVHVDAPLAARAARTPGVDQLQRALGLTRTSLDEARGSMRQLRTSDVRPLPEALDALARTFTADTGIRVHLHTSGRPALPAAEEQEVLHIAAEALTNIRKHARATEIEVALVVERDTLRLEIADDGVGFDPGGRTEGFGLIGMRERAEGLGGHLRILSHPPTLASAAPKEGAKEPAKAVAQEAAKDTIAKPTAKQIVKQAARKAATQTGRQVVKKVESEAAHDGRARPERAGPSGSRLVLTLPPARGRRP